MSTAQHLKYDNCSNDHDLHPMIYWAPLDTTYLVSEMQMIKKGVKSLKHDFSKIMIPYRPEQKQCHQCS